MSGKVITEGDQALKANIARELFNVDGAGIKVGIISTSFDAQKKASDDVISGDLPGTDNPDGRVTPVQILKDLIQLSPSHLYVNSQAPLTMILFEEQRFQTISLVVQEKTPLMAVVVKITSWVRQETIFWLAMLEMMYF